MNRILRSGSGTGSDVLPQLTAATSSRVSRTARRLTARPLVGGMLALRPGASPGFPARPGSGRGGRSVLCEELDRRVHTAVARRGDLKRVDQQRGEGLRLRSAKDRSVGDAVTELLERRGELVGQM